MEQDFQRMRQLLSDVIAASELMINRVYPLWTQIYGVQELPATNIPGAINALSDLVEDARRYLQRIPSFRAQHFPIRYGLNFLKY